MIHLKSCEKKFISEQSQLPRGKRKKLPPRPAYLGGPGGGEDGGAVTPQRPASASAAGVGMKGGPTGAGGISGMTDAQLKAANDAAFREFNDKQLESCPNCGRTFLPDRLAIHLKSCKVEAPAKRVTDGARPRGGIGGGGAILKGPGATHKISTPQARRPASAADAHRRGPRSAEPAGRRQGQGAMGRTGGFGTAGGSGGGSGPTSQGSGSSPGTGTHASPLPSLDGAVGLSPEAGGGGPDGFGGGGGGAGGRRPEFGGRRLSGSGRG